MIYCSQCGAANTTDAKFCPSCGNALVVASNSATQTMPSSAAATPPPATHNTSSNNNLKYLFIGIIAAACVATAFFLVKTFGGKSENAATTAATNAVPVEVPDANIPSSNPNDVSPESQRAEAAAAEEIAKSIAARQNMPTTAPTPTAAATTTVVTNPDAPTSNEATAATDAAPVQSLKDMGTTRLDDNEMHMVSNVMNSYFEADNAGNISKLLEHFEFPVQRYYDMRAASSSALAQRFNAFMNEKLAYHKMQPNLETSMVTKEGDNYKVELLGTYTWETYKTPGVRKSKPVHLKFILNQYGNITSIYE